MARRNDDTPRTYPCRRCNAVAYDFGKHFLHNIVTFDCARCDRNFDVQFRYIDGRMPPTRYLGKRYDVSLMYRPLPT